jgi:hypothetical protein
MNIENKFSVLADEIRDETIAEIRNKLLPRLISIENELNSIKDILRVHTKIEIISNEEGEGKVAIIRKAVLGFLKEKQLNMSDLRELINRSNIVSPDNEGDQSTVRGVISALHRDNVILKADDRMRNSPYYINPNPPVNKKYTRKHKPASDPVYWDIELPLILKNGPKTTKEVMGIIAEKYGIDCGNQEEKYRLSNNLRYATFHQEKKGKIEKNNINGILYLALPGWNQGELKLVEPTINTTDNFEKIKLSGPVNSPLTRKEAMAE